MNNQRILQQAQILFKQNNHPVILTPGQLDIFKSIVFRENKRVEFITCTQYGKSWTVALAALIVSCIQGEQIAILAPTAEKAKVIMRYYIEHLGDNPFFYEELEKDTKLERLKQEESKERIILRNGGGIYVISTQNRTAKASVEAAMGAGCKNVVTDEASLISNQTEATIFRMIAGKGEDAFYCKIGNPFYRNHFYESYLDDNYKKIIIDYRQAIAEGRYNESFIAEARKKPFFDILYECKFPSEDLIDEKGYQQLLTEAQIRDAFCEIEPIGKPRLGVDIGRGINASVFVIRYDNYAFVAEKNQSKDLMTQVNRIEALIKDYKIECDNVAVDDVGVGGGVVDRLAEKNILVVGVKEGGKAEDEKFLNVKAENYWLLSQWIKEGGKLKESSDWFQLQNIKYKEDSSSRLKIEPKEELMRRGIPSPDVADALMLTFSNKENITADDFGFF